MIQHSLLHYKMNRYYNSIQVDSPIEAWAIKSCDPPVINYLDRTPRDAACHTLVSKRFTESQANYQRPKCRGKILQSTINTSRHEVVPIHSITVVRFTPDDNPLAILHS